MKPSSLLRLALIPLLTALCAAKFALATQIDTNFPGATQASSTPGGMINNFYNFALMAGGILAFGVIVYGGIRYTMAGGNPSSAEEGKKWIQQAFWGLLLLFGAYIVLNTINPNLTSLSLPSLTPPAIQTSNAQNTAQPGQNAFQGPSP